MDIEIENDEDRRVTETVDEKKQQETAIIMIVIVCFTALAGLFLLMGGK